jgi:hypothetical protein
MDFEDDTFTIVGGLSNVKDVMCNEEPPDESEHKGTYMQHLLWCDASLDDIAPLAEEYSHEVLTHVGSSSLFLEHVTAEIGSPYNQNTFDPGIVTVLVKG